MLCHHVRSAEAPGRRHDRRRDANIRFGQHDRRRARSVNLTTLEPQAREIIQRYDQPRAAVLPLLWLGQQNFRHISPEGEVWGGPIVGPGGFPALEGGSLLHLFPDTTTRRP